MKMEGTIKTACDYEQFRPDDYLRHFYSEKACDDGLRLPTFALLQFSRRLAHRDSLSLLDVGSGPTVYAALCFREHVQRIYLSDFAEQNRVELQNWLKGSVGHFDWTAVVKQLATAEGQLVTAAVLTEMETTTRAKIQAVLNCDVHADKLLLESPATVPPQFDVVTSVFCLESASSTYEQYARAMRNVVARVKIGGTFIIGSVLEDDVYSFGEQNHFELLYLTESNVVDAMAAAGIDTDRLFTVEHDGAYFAMGTKVAEVDDLRAA